MVDATRTRRTTRPSWVGALVAVVAVLVGGAGIAPAVAATRRDSTPAKWDSRIAPIAAKVAKLRKLDFEHPVPVRFLSETDFSKQQRTERSSLSKSDEADLTRSQGQLRALGLIAQDADLFDASNDIKSSDVLAYYDPATKRITVKGKGPLDVATRVTLAHELTHVLQDQHFDLQKLNRIGAQHHASDAVRTMVEGDAVRIQQLYLGDLSSADQKKARDEQQAQSDQAKSDAAAQQVPDMLLALFDAPYSFGPSFVQAAQGGLDGGIDALFEDPPTADAEYLDPSTMVDRSKFDAVPTPKVGAGEKRVGKPDVFGAFGLYLVLASRLGPADALTAADAWRGDSMISFERNGQNCLRATMRGGDAAGTKVLSDALRMWSATMPAGTTTVDAAKDGVTLTACDTGVAGAAPAHAADEIINFAASRDTLYASLLQQGAPSAAAKCTADGVVRDASFAPLLANPDTEPDAATLQTLRTRVTAIAKTCRTPSSS